MFFNNFNTGQLTFLDDPTFVLPTLKLNVQNNVNGEQDRTSKHQQDYAFVNDKLKYHTSKYKARVLNKFCYILFTSNPHPKKKYLFFSSFPDISSQHVYLSRNAAGNPGNR